MLWWIFLANNYLENNSTIFVENKILNLLNICGFSLIEMCFEELKQAYVLADYESAVWCVSQFLIETYAHLLQNGSEVPLLLTAAKFLASLTRTWRDPLLAPRFLLLFVVALLSGGTNFSPTISSPLELSNSSKGSDCNKHKLFILLKDVYLQLQMYRY